MNVADLIEYCERQALQSQKETYVSFKDEGEASDNVIASIYISDKIARLIIDLTRELKLRGFDDTTIADLMIEEFEAQLG
jgi:hypothetical protein